MAKPRGATGGTAILETLPSERGRFAGLTADRDAHGTRSLYSRCEATPCSDRDARTRSARRRMLVVVLALLAFWCAPPAFPSPDDNSLVVALERFPEGFNPAVASGSLTSQIGAQLFAGLVRIERGTPVPYLAESWEINDRATRFRFHIRKGATFHDGTPITAKDVAFSIRAAKEHHPFRSMLAAVDALIVADDLTLDLETAIPQPALLRCFIPALVPILPAHVYGDGQPLAAHPANRAVVGSGPFRLVSLDERTVVLERYERFFLPGRPYLDRVIFRAYWGQTEIPLAIMQGEADLYAFSSLGDEERIFRSRPDIEVTRAEFGPLHPFALMVFNYRNPLFRSPEVRKALAMSIDNRALAEAVPGGVRPMYGPIPPGSSWHSPVSTPYDPDEANRILDRAGFPRDENGIRFTVEIDYEPSAQFTLSLLKYLQSQFIRTIGVYFRIRTAETPESWAERVTSGAFEVTMDELYGWHDPAIGIERIYATNTSPILWSNMSRYSDPEVDALFRAASAESDTKRRKALYASLQERLAREHVALWLCTIPYATIRNRNLLHVADQPFGILSPLDEARWKRP